MGAEPVDHYLQQTWTGLWIRDMHAGSASQQRFDITGADVISNRTGPLSQLQQFADQPEQCLHGLWDDAARAGPGSVERFGQSPVSSAPVQYELSHEREERLGRPAGVEQGTPLIDHLLHAIQHNGTHQIVLRGKVAVQSARAHSGLAGNIVQRYGQPMGGEHLIGHVQHPRTIARRVGTQRSLCSPQVAFFDISKRG